MNHYFCGSYLNPIGEVKWPGPPPTSGGTMLFGCTNGSFWLRPVEKQDKTNMNKTYSPIKNCCDGADAKPSPLADYADSRQATRLVFGSYSEARAWLIGSNAPADVSLERIQQLRADLDAEETRIRESVRRIKKLTIGKVEDVIEELKKARAERRSSSHFFRSNDITVRNQIDASFARELIRDLRALLDQ